MPEQDYWETLLDGPAILDRFALGPATRDVAELGCGYGTFTIPVAQRISGRVIGIDVAPSMVERTLRRARDAGLANVDAYVRDVLTDGFGVAAGSCDVVLLFNILHCEEPVAVMRAARDAVRVGGLVAVIHWRSDIATPRGPSASIRPSPEQILAWASAQSGLEPTEPPFMLPPWHYGVSLRKTAV